MGKRSSPAVESTHIHSVKKGDVSNHAMQMVNGRTRLKGLIVCGNAVDVNSGNLKLYNGDSSAGTIELEMDIGDYSAYGGTQMIRIPGNGILFDSGIYMEKSYSGPASTGRGVLSVVAIYQGGAAA